MHEYVGCYATLGVYPDADWATVRAEYRRLIGQWHPDRFAADSPERKSAEERSKRITAAYQALAKYRRVHGSLPRASPAGGSSAIPQDRGPWADRAGSGGGARMEAGGQAAGKGLRRRGRRVAIAAVSLVVILYLGYEHIAPVPPRPDGPDGARGLPGSQPRGEETAAPEAKGILSIGSTLGDVIAIQGIPTLAKGDVWHYGKSEIRFSQGKVVAWREDPENPLRIARNQPVQLRNGTFGFGSTKDEVRETQGAPVVETATVWDYGLSRVFFEDDRVVRWEESPVQPLRVR